MSLETVLLQHGVPARYAKAARSMLAYGTEGAVYDIGRGQVLKVNVKAKHQHFENVARRVKGKRWAAAPLAWGPLTPPGDRARAKGRGAKGAPAARGFWYTAYKMNPVSPRERRVLDAIGFSIIAHAKGHLSASAAKAKWEQGLAMLPAELASVLRSARRAGYHDLHGRNVMRTPAGHYKVIDVESLRPLPRSR